MDRAKQEGIGKSKYEEAFSIVHEIKKILLLKQIAKFTKISVEEIEKLKTCQ